MEVALELVISGGWKSSEWHARYININCDSGEISDKTELENIFLFMEYINNHR